MKTLLIAVAAASLMLGACSSSKTTKETKTPNISVEEAIAQCQQASGANGAGQVQASTQHAQHPLHQDAQILVLQDRR